MGFCACDGTTRNTGVPNKQSIVTTGVMLIAVPMKADDGTPNQILATEVVDQAYLDARINHEDESKRWRPIGLFENEEDVRADTITETFTSGSSALTQQGVRAYSGVLLDYAPYYVKTLKSFRCREFGIYSVNTCNVPTGSISSDGLALNPVRVNKSSWNPQYVKGTPTTTAKIMLTFEFSQIELDENLRVLSEDLVTADFLGSEGLIELAANTTSISVTGFTSSIKIDYDIFQDAAKTVVPAWLLADFSLFNKATNSSIAITSVTEAPEGTYTFVIPTQTTGDVIELTNLKTSATKAGFSLEETITIP